MSEKNFSSYGDMETLVTEISSKIASKTDKLKNTDSFYGTCSTAAGTAAKVVTLVNADNFSLRPGVTVTVKFSATNTAQNPTINVNGTGAKSVWYNTAAITTGSLWAAGGAVDRPVRYTYDGTYWVWMGQSTDADTTYSSISLQEIKTGTATNQRSVQPSVLNPAIKMYCPHYATCTSQAANQKKTIVVADTNFQLYTGCIIAIKFDANNTYTPTADAPVMFNVNSTGDKEVRGGSNVTVRITNTTSISVFGVSNRIIAYQYDGTYWVKIGQSWDDNTTYTPQSLGFGYGTCGTAAATAAKVVTLSGYALVNNGIVAVKFTYDVPASATMNINGKGAKAIYYHGAAITDGIIKAGDTATFIYISNVYHLISFDSKGDSYTEITYEDWLQLTPYQQEHGRWDVTGVPGADGTVSIDLMTKLWENPSPTSAFAEQSLQLGLLGYDLIMTIATNGIISIIENVVGKEFAISEAASGASGTAIRRRLGTITATGISWAEGYNSTSWQVGTVNNSIMIPYQIYGIKLHHTVEIKAIAPTVSTLAKNSVFNPTGTGLESTNAEDAIKELESNFQDGVDAVYNAVVAKGSTPASHSLSDIITGIGNIPTGITPTGTINITSNGTKDVTNYASANVNVPNSNSGTYTASSSSAALDMGAANTYRYVNTSALTKVSGTKSITANGNSQDVKSYQYVNVSVPNSNSTTYKATTRSSKIDLGATNTYRYLVTSNVPNSNSGTYTASSSSAALDMGAANTYRYVNTSALTKVSGTKTITADGTYDVSSYQKVTVSVSKSKTYYLCTNNHYEFCGVSTKSTTSGSEMFVTRDFDASGAATAFTVTL